MTNFNIDNIDYNFNPDEINNLVKSLNEVRILNVINIFLITISLLMSNNKNDFIKLSDLIQEFNIIKESMNSLNLDDNIKKKILKLCILFINFGNKGFVPIDPTAREKIKYFKPKPRIAKSLASIFVPDIATQIGGNKYRLKKVLKSIKKNKKKKKSFMKN